ncbi:MAG TPA: hypothetical protein VN780_12075 [Candidatus Eisenbacteria bacterium]|jgi:uncharacterized protein YihD (DUF1040 family)|nr:hypothetical protein [Candidatus Eisenbacteria bacterium]
MSHDLDAMKLALRILAALNEHRAPDQADVQMLRSLAHNDERFSDLDELACDVLQVALKQRAAARRAAAQ